MRKATTVKQVGEFLGGKGGSSIGFVPTMGALHSGHLSLVERARAENDVVVVSIFVNPTQFNDPRDLETYPRMESEDIRLLEQAGADLVFIPSVKDIYPEPDTRIFDFGPVAEVMEGASRPGHFNGVGQVVSRLFDIVKPRRAYFGEKDFQQVAVIRRMVGMLGMDVEIVACPTVREKDGLALSSRNLLLTPPHRAAAPKIYAALKEAQAKKGEMSVEETIDYVTKKINADPLLRVEYFKIVDAATLQDVHSWDGGEKRGCVVVRAGNVRLIDNIGF